MAELAVKELQSRYAGRLIVRLHWDYRNGIDRYGIAKITNNKNGKSLLILVLAHDDSRAIYMPYDLRSMSHLVDQGEASMVLKITGSRVRVSRKLASAAFLLTAIAMLIPIPPSTDERYEPSLVLMLLQTIIFLMSRWFTRGRAYFWLTILETLLFGAISYFSALSITLI